MSKKPKELKELEKENTIIETEKEKVARETPPPLDFDNIYNDIHSKFPKIINLDKPVLLAVGIKKEMAEATGIPGVTLNKWLMWYFRRSRYYLMHVEGAKRYNLQGEEARVVTEEHVLARAKQLKQFKQYNKDKLFKTTQSNSKISDSSDSLDSSFIK